MFLKGYMNFIPYFNNLFLYPKSNKQTTGGGIGKIIGFTILPLDGTVGLGAALTILRLPPRELMVSVRLEGLVTGWCLF